MTLIEQYVIDNVRDRRNAIRLSQASLAQMIGVSEGFIADVEGTKRRAKYNLNHLNELAKVFKCSPGDLLPKGPFEKNKLVK